MQGFLIITACLGTLGAAAIGIADPAAAVPTGNSAADVASNLSAEGYRVAFNGSMTAPLTECKVTDVHSPLSISASRAEKENTTVFIGLDCPSMD